MKTPPDLRPVSGRLGILLPGLGAVATTFIAGVEMIRRGLAGLSEPKDEIDPLV